MEDNPIKWDLEKKLSRETEENKRKALGAAQSHWNRFHNLLEKASRRKGITATKLVKQLRALRSSLVQAYEEFNVDPPELILELIDEKIYVLSANKIQFLHGEEFEFSTRSELEQHEKMASIAGKDGFLTFFIKREPEQNDAPYLCAIFDDGECMVIGQLEHTIRITYPSYTQVLNVLSQHTDGGDDKARAGKR